MYISILYPYRCRLYYTFVFLSKTLNSEAENTWIHNNITSILKTTLQPNVLRNVYKLLLPNIIVLLTAACWLADYTYIYMCYIYIWKVQLFNITKKNIKKNCVYIYNNARPLEKRRLPLQTSCRRKKKYCKLSCLAIGRHI